MGLPLLLRGTCMPATRLARGVFVVLVVAGLVLVGYFAIGRFRAAPAETPALSPTVPERSRAPESAKSPEETVERVIRRNLAEGKRPNRLIKEKSPYFARAHQVLGDERYRKAAERAGQFILDRLYRPGEGRLLRRGPVPPPPLTPAVFGQLAYYGCSQTWLAPLHIRKKLAYLTMSYELI